MDDLLPETTFLTEDEVAARYRGAVSPGTLRNWRSQRQGPPWVKVGKSALYPRRELEDWEARNTVRPQAREACPDQRS